MKTIDLTPVQQAISHIQANINGIGIIMNESGLTDKEKRHYITTCDCLRITKIYLENLLPIEEEFIKIKLPKMKTIDLEEIKNQVAVKHGYCEWSSLIYNIYKITLIDLIDEVATEFAKQSCDLQIKECGKSSFKMCSDHILSTPNVVTTNTK